MSESPFGKWQKINPRLLKLPTTKAEKIDNTDYFRGVGIFELWVGKGGGL